MRCPYCGQDNDEAIEACRKCGRELSVRQGPWKGPDTPPSQPAAPGALSGYEEWDPARRFSQPRSMSAFAPPAKHPSYLGWALTVTLLCFPPTGIVAIFFAGLVKGRLARGDETRAYRYSRLAYFWCRLSLIIGIVIYVGLFLWFMFWIGELWNY